MTSLTHGILMSGEMIRAYQKGLKRETRRVTKSLQVVNEDPDNWELIFVPQKSEARFVSFAHKVEKSRVHHIRLPYGVVGESLWFKETYAPMCRVAVPECFCETAEEIQKNHYMEYRADTRNPYPGDWPEEEARGNPEAPKWRSSMFMKHEYARFIDIPILGVRVERLLDISNIDAVHEGCPMDVAEAKTPRQWYFDLWDRLNGDRMPADTNPWVWVYQFSKYQENDHEVR